LSRIMKATGFSRRYASMARRGLFTPHPVHYDALATLVGSCMQAKPKDRILGGTVIGGCLDAPSQAEASR